jgi:hypothetical protein
LTSDERQRLKALEGEVVDLNWANEILRKASAYFAQAELDRRPKVMVVFVDQHRDTYGVEPICAQLPIAPLPTSCTRPAADPTCRSPRAQRDELCVDI